MILASVAASTASATPRIGAKQAEAERVLAQIQQIDAQLELAVDAYNAAQIQVEQIGAQLRLDRRNLRIVRANYARAQAAIASRLVSLYKQGDPSLVELLLGASSLNDVVDRVDTVNRVSDQYVRIVRDVRRFRTEIRKDQQALRQSLLKHKRALAERATRKAAIEGQLAERQRLLSSIKDEIVKLQVQEAARQRRLAAAARARLESDPPTAPVDAASAAPGDPPPARFGGVVGIAMQYLGIPYQWAGSSPDTGFDCSGFVMYVFAQMGVSLPHNAASQWSYGTPVSRDQLEPGDLVFFDGLGHDGIYIGAGQFIHSPHTGDVVKISSLDEAWYAATYVGARRL